MNMRENKARTDGRAKSKGSTSKAAVLTLAAIGLNACVSTTGQFNLPDFTSSSPSSPSPSAASGSSGEAEKKPRFVYEPPEGSEEFVMTEITGIMQKIGYSSFCKTLESDYCRDPLPYDQFVGKKGFFETAEPIPAKSSYSDYEFWPVTFENGVRIYYKNSKGTELFSSSAPFTSTETLKSIANTQRTPFIAGSSIYITHASLKYGTEYVHLSNGVELTREQLPLYQKIAARIGPNDKAIDLLTKMEIKTDKVRGISFISPKLEGSDTYKKAVYMYVGHKDGDTWLRFKLRYYGNDWLFVERYIVAADDFRWTSTGREEWERDNTDSVWEWIDVTADDQTIRTAKKIADAKESIIRFEGRQYYADFTVPAYMKRKIHDVLTVYNALK